VSLNPFGRIVWVAAIPDIAAAKPELKEIAVLVFDYFTNLDCADQENDGAK
jgi:hypothetical protein